MTEFKQAKKLDAVLRYMEKGGLPRYETGIQISKGLKIEKSEQTELYLILNKLVKDGVIDYKEVELPNPTGVKRVKPIIDREYIINFEGLFLIQSEGYLQQAKNRHAESIRLGKLEIVTKANQLLTT